MRWDRRLTKRRYDLGYAVVNSGIQKMVLVSGSFVRPNKQTSINNRCRFLDKLSVADVFI